MRTFFFDFQDGPRTMRDLEGHSLACDDDARIEALRALAEVLLYEPSDQDRREVTCEVRGHDGVPLYRASVLVDGRWVAREAGPRSIPLAGRRNT